MTLEKEIKYVCPLTRKPLAFISPNDQSAYKSADGDLYPIIDGIPDFVHPRNLADSDLKSLAEYERIYHEYDKNFEFVFNSFKVDQVAFRKRLVGLLGLKAGMTVLDVGCGTGQDSLYIATEIGPSGKLFVQDLSRGMLTVCREKLKGAGINAEASLANGAYLPFANGSFDAVFHFGGINTFAQKKMAISEMTRVCKVGGRVLVGDESMPLWLRGTEFGKVVMTMNPLYKHFVPFEEIPVEARNTQVNWLLNEVFYAISFDVEEGAPIIDMDYPIPGRRGGTPRSRYYDRAAEKVLGKK
jgi:ubiquinone/menaquinone biosynthesis C-methylase UbiE/uncharacterized protein YbaR (Trm112 family)